MSQQTDALCLGNIVRGDLRDLKHAMRTGAVDWRDVILDPPSVLADKLLSEVLLLVPSIGRPRVERLGRLAHGQGITLTVRAGRSSLRTREWVVENALVSSGRRARPHRSGLSGGRTRREGLQT